MPSRAASKIDTASPPLYRDIHEFIEVMGIKHTRVVEAFGISRSYWFKLKKHNMNGLSIENMHNFAIYFNLPPEKVMTLCYTAFLQKPTHESSADKQSEDRFDEETDSDFPPII